MKKADTVKKKLIIVDKGNCYNWLISIVINAIVLLGVLSCTDMMYETNDDFGISDKINNDYPYVGFVNYFLCKGLIAIQNMTNTVNVFMLSQVILSFVAFVIILKVILDRDEGKAISVIASVSIAIYALDHYCCLQFTKTSALLMLAGLMLLVDNYLHERRLWLYILAYFMFYVGVAYRQKGMFPALAFAAAFLLLWSMLNKFEGCNQSGNVKREIILAIVCVVIAVVPYGIDMASDVMNASTPELAYARDYQAERVKITDYPTYEYYEQNKEAYDAAGLSENDIYLVTHWMLDYDGAASYENLKKINEINRDCIAANRSVSKAIHSFISNTRESLKNFGFSGSHILIPVVVGIYLLLTTRPKNWLYVVAFGALTVGLHVVLYYLGRPQYRAFYVADISAVFWILYAAAMSERPKLPSWLRWIPALACTAIIATMFFPLKDSLNRQCESLTGKIESDTFVQFYQDNSDTFYVCSTSSKKRHPSYLDPMKIPTIEKNATGMGGWGTLSKYELDQLEKYGMKNLVGDQINNENVYFVGDTNLGRLTEYYNKWYAEENEAISFVYRFNIEGTNFYQIIKI